MKELRTYSLRRRLIWWISLSILGAVLCALLASTLFARHEIEEVYDAQLVHSAKVLLQLTQHEITQDEDFELGIENTDLQHKYERNLGFRIWYKGVLITQSPNTKTFETFEATPGFSTAAVNGREWRFFVFIDAAKNIRIEVSERYDIRYELIAQLILSLLLPSIIFIPFILIVIWVIVRNSLKPISNISADVDSRNSSDLHPIQGQRLPEEIAPLIEALNRLFTRIEESFQREREFTDNAAHELRTPLAAMKTQTQVLMKKAQDMSVHSEGLENLQSSIDRATRMVEQLLSLARLQNEELPKEAMNFSQCVEDIVKDSQSLAKKKSIALQTSITPDIEIKANHPAMEILLHNIIDNAIKYTPNGGKVHITLNSAGLLQVADTGPGLPDDDKTRVFERFYRSNKSGQSGSGLGLSIVNWIANEHGYRLDIKDNEDGGTIFSLHTTE